MKNCTPVTFSPQSCPRVYARDATGNYTVSSKCRLFRCDNGDPNDQSRYFAVPSCLMDSSLPGCTAPGSSMVQCFVDDCRYRNVPQFILPTPASVMPCDLNDFQLCQHQSAPSFACMQVIPGYQRPGDPPGCYAGSDPCGIVMSGTNLVPAKPGCVVSCCDGNMTNPYFQPYYPPILPWWMRS